MYDSSSIPLLVLESSRQLLFAGSTLGWDMERIRAKNRTWRGFLASQRRMLAQEEQCSAALYSLSLSLQREE
jgi:hypothetical protein